MNNKKKRFSQSLIEDLTSTMSIVMPVMTECDKDEDFSSGLDSLGEFIPLLPLRNMVLFPGVALSVVVGRDKSLKLIEEAIRHKALIGVVAQIKGDTEDPHFDDLYHYGTVAEVMRVFDLPGGTTTVVLQGKRRFQLEGLVNDDPFLLGRYHLAEETRPNEQEDREFSMVVSRIKDLTVKILKTREDMPTELVRSIQRTKNLIYQINYPCGNLSLSLQEKQKLLEFDDLKERAMYLLEQLGQLLQLEQLKASIQMKTQCDINQQQKEYFLQQQIKNLQAELGSNSNDIELDELYERAAGKEWSVQMRMLFEKEARKLERLSPQSPDYSMQSHYVNTLLALPWEHCSKDNFNLARAQRILDRDHYGLEKVKERIIEHLAVLKLKGDMKAPILCLYGPPGVGKTSLGKSIAEALGRKYVRMSLGGLHDEAEIRGHRRTYIGAMCGRILQGLQKAGTSNPVFVLDEIDKISCDFKGDPASALLEVLDPEQNNAFHDNYLDVDYDLSQVFFIATANSLSTISPPLLDRMELIEVSGYITEEKIEIASRHLVPNEMEAHGLKKGCVRIPKKTLQEVVESYTRESGVRELDKQLAKLMRKLARKVAFNELLPTSIKVTDLVLPDYLGPVRYTRDKYQGNGYAGVVTGLAWTAVGGEILFVESSLSKGKGEKLTLTGNLGDVMKESAMLALQYVHAHAADFEIDEQRFEQWNVHIHVPEGAIPKDGPSAGITMVTSLVSTFTQRKVRKQLAMTGEITLRGKVLPVGGIKEKILAAKRAGITQLILCQENEKDILEINSDYLKGLTFYYVDDIRQVIDLALLLDKVDHPLF
ncbi:MAG: endopeptidase La [Parabacteroides sp.]